ncbi:B3/4 domain family protein [Brugia pahangi]
MGRVYTQKEFENLLFDYGLELDEVTSEKAAAQKEQSLTKDEDLSKLCDEEIYKIELPANRYDLLCIEGLSRALRIFRSEMEPPIYRRLGSSHYRHQIIIKPEVLSIRPYVVGAVLVGVKLDADSYASLIDLQDKLHQNICRKRTLVAIGTHDLDTVQGPFYYGAEKPADLKFKPLNRTKRYSRRDDGSILGG